MGPLPAAPSRYRGAKPFHANGAPLLPKLRGQFAEFLNRGSLVHLAGLARCLPVSVCGTGCVRLKRHRGFSRRPGHPSPSAASRRLPTRLGACWWVPDLPGTPPLRADRSSPTRPAAGPYRVPPWPSPVTQVQDCPPDSPSPTLHAQQPRLRSRLTLGRRPLPRNPQACGVGGSHTQSSATHSGIRTSVRSTRACRSGFSATPERSPTTRSACWQLHTKGATAEAGPRLRGAA